MADAARRRRSEGSLSPAGSILRRGAQEPARRLGLGGLGLARADQLAPEIAVDLGDLRAIERRRPGRIGESAGARRPSGQSTAMTAAPVMAAKMIQISMRRS